MTRTVFIDVDDTLVRSVGAKRIPIPAVIEGVRRLKSDGAMIYLWSSGGADYWRATASELGISDCIEAYLPKPTIYVDDQPVNEWRSCSHVYPSQINTV